MKKIITLVLAAFTAVSSVFSQEIKTAPNYFKDISAFYETIKDYEADADIKADRQIMKAHVSFKKPNLLRMDFSNPKDQTVVFNGNQLTIYLPGQNAILTQSVTGSPQNGANLATPQGLNLMSRYFAISYEVGPEPVALDDGSDEKVVKLELKRRNLTENFRNIRIAISADTKLIRRIEAVTGANETFVFNFTNYVLNQGIPEQRFIYTPSSAANEYNNFLFSE